MRTLTPQTALWPRVKQIVARRFGLDLRDVDASRFEDAFVARATVVCGGDVERYVAVLESAPSVAELAALGNALSVGETYFFRNKDHVRAFGSVVVPDRLRAQAARKQLSILSAGCSSGEEPFTLAMLLADLLPADWRLELVAMDLNEAALERARAGRYSAWSLRQTSPELQRRWFRPEKKAFVLDRAIHERVTFERRNLVDEDDAFWRPGRFDVIFCRNVLMYLTPAAMRRVVERFATSLAPGGFLFLSEAETLREVSLAFDLLHTHDTFYYRLLGDAPYRGPAAEAPGGDAWFDAIQRSSARIREVTARASAPALTLPPLKVAQAARAATSRAVELAGAEQFVEALAELDRLPPEASHAQAALLLRAVILTNAGRTAEAEALCTRVLAANGLDADAHYVMALCRENAGDPPGAVKYNELAAYLDPVFAMPRFHLGLVCKRAGDTRRARRELGDALVLLEREDPERVLLLGGGFTRDALVRVCRAELRGLEGTT